MGIIIGILLMLASYQVGYHRSQVVWAQRVAKESARCLAQVQDQCRTVVSIESQYCIGASKRQSNFHLQREKLIHAPPRLSTLSTDCTIAIGFTRVWNSANQAFTLPGAASESDGAPTNLTLHDIIVQHLREAELCYQNTSQLIALQHWVRAQQRVR